MTFSMSAIILPCRTWLAGAGRSPVSLSGSSPGTTTSQQAGPNAEDGLGRGIHLAPILAARRRLVFAFPASSWHISRSWLRRSLIGGVTVAASTTIARD